VRAFAIAANLDPFLCHFFKVDKKITQLHPAAAHTPMDYRIAIYKKNYTKHPLRLFWAKFFF